MIDATLERVEMGDQGTFGMLRFGDYVLHTGELPWRNNAVGLSCIRPGLYSVIWLWSPHLKRRCYRLMDVPGRSGILIHSANYMGDIKLGYIAQLQGCISPGMRRGVMASQKAILNSLTATRYLVSYFKQAPFSLEIKWAASLVA